MAQYQTISDFLLELLEPNKIIDHEDERLINLLLDLLEHELTQEVPEWIFFEHWLLRLFTSENSKSSILIRTANLLKNYNSESLFSTISGLSGNRSTKLLKKIVSLSFEQPLTKANSFYISFLNILPANVQIEVLTLPFITDSLNSLLQDYYKQLKEIGNSTTPQNSLSNSTQYEITEISHFLNTSILTLGSIILDNWNSISSKSVSDYRDISLEFWRIFIGQFLSESHFQSIINPSPFSATIEIIDNILYQYLCVQFHGLHSIPLCFLNKFSPYNQSYSFLITRILPKILFRIDETISIILKYLSEDPNSSISIPSCLLFQSIWDLTNPSSSIFENIEYIYKLETWALRSSIVFLLNINVIEFTKNSNILKNIKTKLQKILNYVITFIEKFSKTDIQPYFALYMRALMTLYILESTDSKDYFSIERPYELTYTVLNKLCDFSILFDSHYISSLYVSNFLILGISNLLNHLVELYKSATYDDIGLSIQSLNDIYFLIEKAIRIVLFLLSSTEMNDYQAIIFSRFQIPWLPNVPLELWNSKIPQSSMNRTTSKFLKTIFGPKMFKAIKHTNPTRNSKFKNLLGCLPSSNIPISYHKKFETLLHTLYSDHSSILQRKSSIDYLKNIPLKTITVTDKSGYLDYHFLHSLSSFSYSLLNLSYASGNVSLIGFFWDFLIGQYVLENSQIFLNEAFIASLCWFTSFSIMSIFPKHIEDISKLPFHQISLKNTHYFYSERIKWLEYVSILLNFFWQLIHKLDQHPSARYCVNSCIIWILLGSCEIFYDAGLFTNHFHFHQQLIEDFIVTLTVLISDLSHFVSYLNLRENSDLWSLITCMAYLITSIKSLTLSDEILETINLQQATVVRLLKLFCFPSDDANSYLNDFDHQICCEDFSPFFTQRVLENLEHPKQIENKQNILTDEQINHLAPDPLIGSLIFPPWHNTLLFDRLQKIKGSSSFNSEILTKKKVLYTSPLMLIVSQNSKFASDAAIVTFNIELHNITDYPIEDINLQIQPNIPLSKSAFQTSSHAYYSNILNPTSYEKHSPILSEIEILTSNNTSFSLSAKSVEFCQFTVRLNTFVAAEVLFSISFWNSLDDPSEDIDDDLNSKRVIYSNKQPQSNIKSYYELKESMESFSDNYFQDFLKSPVIGLFSTNMNLELSAFFQPFYGYGTMNKYILQKYFQSNDDIHLKLNDLLIPSQSSFFKSHVWIEKHEVIDCRPSCFHLFYEDNDTRFLIASLFEHSELIIISFKFNIDNDDLGIKWSNKLPLALVEIFSTSDYLSKEFATYFKYWLYQD